MIKAVIFDLDDTLYSYVKANNKAFSLLQKFVEKKFGWSPEEFKKMHDDMFQEHLRTMGPIAAAHNRLIRFQAILDRMEKPSHYALEMHDLYWNALIEAAELYDKVPEVLKELKEAGLKIGIGTNMTSLIQYKKLAKFNVLHLFDFIVTSEEAGIDKPDSKFFNFCLKKAKCKPQECLFVGDSEAHDIKGALGANMKALQLYEDNENIKISNLCLQTTWGTFIEDLKKLSIFDQNPQDSAIHA